MRPGTALQVHYSDGDILVWYTPTNQQFIIMQNKYKLKHTYIHNTNNDLYAFFF